ncbi:MAG: T9SS type A sorting domain-containing protein, partial [Candidatus Latescibacteria bacterium]|nr:T9SS type A sorting domain-containing protein [bacterium]MBD3425357.1 T9SS type A sorting domain-containing protein [Candidatus Latescibacterota bacterium]
INISNPAAPIEEGSFSRTGHVEALAIEGNLLCAAYGSYGLYIIDISNPILPTELGWWETSDMVRDVDISGDYAYIADHGAGVRIIDISTPSNPSRRDSVSVMYSYAKNITLDGSYAYLSFGIKGVRIFNVSNPDLITLAGTFYQYYHSIYNIAISGDKAYVAASNDGLKVLDVTDPSSAAEVSVHGTAGVSQKAAVTGDYCFVSMGKEGFTVLDITDPASAATVIIADTLTCNSIAIDGDYAYIAGGDEGVRVFDISGISTMNETGIYDTPGNVYDVAVSGSYAYIADGTAGFLVLDISDPASPDSAGACPTAHIANGLALDGNYAYLSDHDGGLRVIDISDPANPLEIDSYSGCDYANDVAISGNYAYLTDWAEGVRILDISEPDNISLAGSRSYNIVEGISVSGNYAYVAAQSDGIRVLDIHSAPSVIEKGFYDTGGTCVSTLVTSNDIIIAPDGICGIYFLSNPLVPVMVFSYRTNPGPEGITVSWQLSEPARAEEFQLLRRKTGEAGFAPLILPVMRDHLQYSFTDRDCLPGEEYIYRVMLGSGEDAVFLLQTDPASIPSPAAFALHNSPNPFNPSTRIRYHLPGAGLTALRVYDTSGRLVSVLVDGIKKAGWHETAWDGADRKGDPVCSGIYFCRLEAGKSRVCRKMVLLR